MTTEEKIKELLDNHTHSGYGVILPLKLVHLLNEQLEAVIGPDESNTSFEFDGRQHPNTEVIARNDLRTEQRQRAKQLLSTPQEKEEHHEWTP